MKRWGGKYAAEKPADGYVGEKRKKHARRKAGKWLCVCEAVGRAADCFKGRRASRCLGRGSNRQAAEKSGI